MAPIDIVQCKICRKPFQSYGGAICGDCLKEADNAFVKVRDYLYDHPGRWNTDSLAEAAEVPKAMIRHLVTEKRLTLEPEHGSGPVCEVCKKPIAGGRMCENCQKMLFRKLADGLPSPPKPAEKTAPQRTAPRMHIDTKKK